MDEKLINDYLASSKKHHGKLTLGVILATLVFVVPMIFIISNQWWGPFGDDPEVGMRWFVTGVAMICLTYVAVIIDKFYRNY